MTSASLPKKILVPVDYHAQSCAALELALRMAKSLDSEVHALHVWTTPYAERALTGKQSDPHPEPKSATLFDEIRAQGEKSMIEFLKAFDAKAEGIDLRYAIISGEPQEKIVSFASEGNFDWIIVGTHGRSTVPRWFLGSVAANVVRHAPCPVLVVPPTQRP